MCVCVYCACDGCSESASQRQVPGSELRLPSVEFSMLCLIWTYLPFVNVLKHGDVQRKSDHV